MLTKIYRTRPNYKGRGWFLNFFKGFDDFIMQKVYLLRLMPVCVNLILLSCLFLKTVRVLYFGLELTMMSFKSQIHLVWQSLGPVFRICDIFVWIRIRSRGSIPLTNGFGFGSCYFRHWPSRCQQKTNFLKKFCCLLLFEDTFTLFFKDKKFKRSHKTVGIKVFLTIFPCW